MKPNLNEWKAEFRAEKSTKTGRELKTLIKTLNRRLRIYQKKGGPKPEVNWKIFDLVSDFDKEVVALCRSRRDYHYVMVQTISLFSVRVADYVYDMEQDSFGMYCKDRNRFTPGARDSAMPFVLKAALFGVPQKPWAYFLMERVLKDIKIESARLREGHPSPLGD